MPILVPFDLDDEETAAPIITSAAGMRLRPYQQGAMEAIEKGWNIGRRRLLVVLPTGCGKTIVFAKESEAEVYARGGRVLILAHTDELCEQAMDKLHKATGIRAEKEKAQDWASHDAPVVVGSMQTLCRETRLSAWDPAHFTEIVVDEAHRILAKSYQKICEHFVDAKVLGVTATPERGDKRSLGNFFGEDGLAFSYSLVDAVLDGWLVRPVAEQVPIEIDLRGITIKRGMDGADYDQAQLEERIAPVMGGICKEIVHYATHHRTVIFTPGIETARMGAEALSRLGIASEWVAGACDDRKERVARFMSGEITHLWNAQLLTEGFDLDAISCVVPLRATKSPSLYRQMVGRGTRTLTGLIDRLPGKDARRAAIAASAKPKLVILDFLWNTEQHSLVRPVHLIAKDEDEAEAMQKKVKNGVLLDLLEAQDEARQTAWDRIAAEVEKHKGKRRRTIDPLSFAIAVQDDDLRDYQPENEKAMAPASAGQIKHLADQGIDVSTIRFHGQASKIIEKLHQRETLGLCTVGQMNFLRSLGYDGKDPNKPDAALMRKEDATRIQRQTFARWKKRGRHG